jgi:predicted nucleic acid-binding protein
VNHGTIVDSNIFLDLFSQDLHWATWSADQLVAALSAGPVIINPLIYAEISLGFAKIEELDAALPPEVVREDLPWDAAFLAAKCFAQYRRAGGTRRSPLPDFYIAAHAAITGRALLTRGRPRYRKLLPDLLIISPG